MAESRKEREYGSARKRAETHESFQRTAIKLPEGLQFFNPKKPGVYRLNIMPYIVGEGHPTEKPGSIWYERTYWSYSQIGPNRQTFVAPGKTFGKRDPIDEYRNELQKQPNYDKDLVRKLFAKERQLFIIQDASEPEKGFQLWDVSFHNFGKFLDQKIKNCDAEDAERYDLFFHPRKGLLLRVTAREKSIGDGKPYLEFNDIEFKERPEQFSSSVVDEMPCLDDLIIETSYKDLKAIFFQSAAASDEEPDGDDDDPIPAKSRRMDDDDDEPAPKKKSRPVDDEDDDPPPKKKKPVDDDEDEPAPKKKSRPVDDEDDDPPPKKKKRPHVDDEDDEPAPKKKKPVDDEDDEPAPKSKTKSKADADDDEDSDSDCPVEKGQWLKFTYKGAKLVGKVVSINESKKLIGVKASDRPEPHNLGWDDEFTITKAPKTDDEDDDEPAPKAKSKPKPPVDDEDDEPAPKKKKPVDDDEDEDEVPSKRSGKKSADDDDDDAPPRKSSKGK